MLRFRRQPHPVENVETKAKKYWLCLISGAPLTRATTRSPAAKSSALAKADTASPHFSYRGCFWGAILAAGDRAGEESGGCEMNGLVSTLRVSSGALIPEVYCGVMLAAFSGRCQCAAASAACAA